MALVSIVHGVSSWCTGPPGHEPAVEFLQSIHQNQTVETVRNACVVGFKQWSWLLTHLYSHAQCDQLEDELLALLQKRRTVLSSALEALHQYRNITSQVGDTHPCMHTSAYMFTHSLCACQLWIEIDSHIACRNIRYYGFIKPSTYEPHFFKFSNMNALIELMDNLITTTYP